MRVLGIIAASAIALFGTAQAASVTVANSDFEADYDLENSAAGYGSWGSGAAGWEIEGSTGTWEFPDRLYDNPPAGLDDRIGYVKNGSMSQSLGIAVEEGVDYTLSAVFGHRNDQTAYEGYFGFFVGDISDALFVGGLMSISDPGSGLFSTQSMTVTAAMLQDYIGQQLGIVFIGENGQIQFDNVQVMAFGEVLENPLPGAVWLFGSALVAGGIAKRRKKAA